MLLAVTCGMALAGACAFCAAQPNKVAAYIRDKHLRSPKWVRNWPFAGIVMKDWYPLYLRVVGVGVETPDGEQFLGASQLSFDITAAVCSTPLVFGRNSQDTPGCCCSHVPVLLPTQLPCL